MDSQEFAHKLMLVESGGDPHAWGDDGLAIGFWQVHPSWVWSVAKLLYLEPLVNESWNEFAGRLVNGFFDYYTERGFTPVQIAMHFHKGHIVYEGASDWDQAYADRFTAAPSA